MYLKIYLIPDVFYVVRGQLKFVNNVLKNCIVGRLTKPMVFFDLNDFTIWLRFVVGSSMRMFVMAYTCVFHPVSQI